MNPKYPARTRMAGRQAQTEIDANTGREWVTGRTRTGRIIEKNRSNGWRGYKSHLTNRQKKIIAWALRQRDRGVNRVTIYNYIAEHDLWDQQPLQYPLTSNTIGAWELTRAAELKRGREWPLPSLESNSA